MTSKLLAVLLAVAPAASLAQAQPSAERNTSWQLALRSGYSVPFGKSTDSSGDDLNKMVSGAVPLALEINYRITPDVYVGAFGRYGFGSLGEPLAAACTGGSCSASTLEIGLGAYYHFRPRDAVDPWLGLGVSYEQMTIKASGAGGSADLTVAGFQFLDLQLGFDYQASRLFAAGPFVSFALGQYSKFDVPGNSGTISNTALHGWFNVGMKLSLNP
ncbi:MAG TPA: outer membrane beta-barrel protein [Anaeromyxobacteraceae bacterium]|nr:outer membrane beta-barrel protein [Anaeromyxobacteraceae bacterium]